MWSGLLVSIRDEVFFTSRVEKEEQAVKGLSPHFQSLSSFPLINPYVQFSRIRLS